MHVRRPVSVVCIAVCLNGQQRQLQRLLLTAYLLLQLPATALAAAACCLPAVVLPAVSLLHAAALPYEPPLILSDALLVHLLLVAVQRLLHWRCAAPPGTAQQQPADRQSGHQQTDCYD